jgi:site-specific recombinase XerD
MPRRRFFVSPLGECCATLKAGDEDRLAAAFFRFLEVERNVSPRTVTNYRHALSAFADQPDLPNWTELNADHFRRYLFACARREMSRTTIRLHFAALRTFFRFLAERHGLKTNPLQEVQLPKPERKLPLLLTPKQVEELLSAPLRVPKQKQAPAWMPVRDAAIMELFYSSGIRLAELVALNVESVDPFSETLRVFGKGRKERLVPVGVPALEAIQKYRREAGIQAGPLFVSKVRKRLTARSVWLLLKRYLRETSIPIKLSPHKLRHSFASLSTTQIYTHVTVERLKRAYDEAHPRA